MTDGYTQTYDAGETSEVVIDILIKILVAVGLFASLIGLGIAGGYIMKKFKGLTKF